MFPHYFRTNNYEYKLDGLNPFLLWVKLPTGSWLRHICDEIDFRQYFPDDYKKIKLKVKLYETVI